ncbi:MAG: protein-L-isoaspartate O-methyltransferase [Steroidobacteraceae bacterium]|nr:protein-L-isoaspartate O-methyltransferase [Steroidobacteraceae bacterium]MDW8260677.1 protein-L-isoaspartate O-methyltransferase [Gammaproteobacteria bacterium]
MRLTDIAREQMVGQQVRAWEVLDPQVLETLASVPRECFVPPAFESLAYADMEIPLPAGQHMLPPKIVGRILQAVQVQPRDRALEIGTGSGYLTACLARRAAQVETLEIEPAIAQFATQNLTRFGVRNVQLHCADAFAPASVTGTYDVIVLTGSLPRYTEQFEAHLAGGGRLFVVVGDCEPMSARLITRAAGGMESRRLFETRIDPLRHAPAVPRFRF